jgi:hypothetical protein
VVVTHLDAVWLVQKLQHLIEMQPVLLCRSCLHYASSAGQNEGLHSRHTHLLGSFVGQRELKASTAGGLTMRSLMRRI